MISQDQVEDIIVAEDLKLAPYETIQEIRGVPFPKEPKFRQFLITGPPGVGKSTMVRNIRGWPYEGFIDISAKKWWRTQALTYRPREIHLGVPFIGIDEGLAVVDKEWLDNADELKIDFARIIIPPPKTWFLSTNWRAHYVFEFMLPDVELIFTDRAKRAKSGLFPHDKYVNRDIVARQLDLYRTIAWYFWKSDMHVYIRTERDGHPMRIVELTGTEPA